MSIEAEILEVTKPGAVMVLVVYRDGVTEQKESFTFSSDGVTADHIREKIRETGRRLLNVASIETLAKGLVGEKIIVDRPVAPQALGRI